MYAQGSPGFLREKTRYATFVGGSRNVLRYVRWRMGCHLNRLCRPIALNNIPILCNALLLFHIDIYRLSPALARLSEGHLAVASADEPLLHQQHEWEIATHFPHERRVRPNLLLTIRIYIRSHNRGDGQRGREHRIYFVPNESTCSRTLCSGRK